MSVAAAARLVVRQSVGDRVSDVKDTLSSWDKCMSKNYCKWPVIVAIVIVSLIVFSLLFCLFRCLCCGAECACCCFRCCASCCPSPSRKSKSHQRVPSHGNTAYNPAPTFPSSAPYRVAPAPVYERPQYARFESTRKNDDALPPMPSWGDAHSYKVEDTSPQPHQDVEMKRLDSNGNGTAAVVPPLATPAGSTPLRTPGSLQHSPTRDSYGFPGGATPYGAQHHDMGSYADSSRYYVQETGVQHHHPQSPAQPHGASHQDAAGFGYRSVASPPPPQYQQRMEPQWQSQQPAGGHGDGYEAYRPYGAGQETGYAGAGRKPVNGSWKDV